MDNKILNVGNNLFLLKKSVKAVVTIDIERGELAKRLVVFPHEQLS